MSKEALSKVVRRSISDAQFRRQLAVDAGTALSGYDLTPDEIGALRSRDAGTLTAFGVETRMSRMFIDQGGMHLPTVTSGGGPRDSEPVWIGDTAAQGAVQTTGSEPRDVAPTWIGDAASPLHTYSGDDNAGPEIQTSEGSEGALHQQ